MDLVQCRIVTDNVSGLGAFYERLLGARVVLNDYYVEIPAGRASVGLSRRQFAEYHDGADPIGRRRNRRRDEVMLDLEVADVGRRVPTDRRTRRRLANATGHPAMGQPLDGLPRPGRQSGQHLLPPGAVARPATAVPGMAPSH